MLLIPTYWFKQEIRISWSPCVYLYCCLSISCVLFCPPSLISIQSLYTRLCVPPASNCARSLCHGFKPASSSLRVLWIIACYIFTGWIFTVLILILSACLVRLLVRIGLRFKFSDLPPRHLGPAKLVLIHWF